MVNTKLTCEYFSSISKQIKKFQKDTTTIPLSHQRTCIFELNVHIYSYIYICVQITHMYM